MKQILLSFVLLTGCSHYATLDSMRDPGQLPSTVSLTLSDRSSADILRDHIYECEALGGVLVHHTDDDYYRCEFKEKP